MLEHVVERQRADDIGRRVDVGAREVKRGLDDEGRGIASLGGRRVVGAGIAALGLDVADFTVLEKEGRNVSQGQYFLKWVGDLLPRQ